MIEHLTSENFKSFISQEDFTLVDFWATWCGPCRMLGPVLEMINDQDNVKVGKVNVDEEEMIAAAFGIQNIPTVLAFKGGKLLGKKVGFLGYGPMMEWINSINK